MRDADLPVDLTFGPRLEEWGTRFRLWAPSAESVELIIHRAAELPGSPPGEVAIGSPVELHGDRGGWYESDLLPLGPGSLYAFRINREIEVPDPASRFQPKGVHGPSEVVDLSGAPGARGARVSGRPWRETILYELHTGTFTSQGGYRGIRDSLEHLRELGVTAIELMPINAFPGERNWGYDGVLPFSPAAAYGRPEELWALVDAAHELELTLYLDVVYNHFGPEGNYLHLYAAPFFTERFHTPWGAAIDFSVPEVRRFFLENALYWTGIHGFDGLRVDAVHAIRDESAEHFVDELARRVRAEAGAGRQVHVVLENEENQASRIPPATAQWNDDVHHLLHVLITGEAEGYYLDYREKPHRMLARTLAEGFHFQGHASLHRDGAPRGEPSGGLHPSSLVAFSHNHDQIGNRAFGERLTSLSGATGAVEAAQALILLSPQTPMLFMGEEWGSTRPFLFFCDYTGELADAVRDGRRREFAGFSAFSEATERERIPDPNDAATFEASRLDWESLDSRDGKRHCERVRALLDLRRRELLPLLDTLSSGVYEGEEQEAMRVLWPASGGRSWVLYFNLTAAQRRLPQFREPAHARTVYPVSGGPEGSREPHPAPGGTMAPWAVVVRLEQE